MLNSAALLTDLYQLTMALGYWRAGIADREACFHLHFRKCPFGGEFAVAAGLESALDFLEDVRFTAEENDYLATLKDARGERLFPDEFLAFLSESPLSLDVDAIAEGTAVFPHEPLLRVTGKLWQAQLVETALLNIINFQTLVATKAARVKRAAGEGKVIEFGLRRAQGVDGGLAASRAAYLGGCAGTSNVLAGKRYGIPVMGTHAHSWVMAFGDEREAFDAYADAMPGNCTFLVDTYDTERGVGIAIDVARKLAAQGAKLNGVRLDSGDLAALSKNAREQLDAAGMHETKVVASNDLDEYRITALREQGAAIDVWGVGTRLATCFDQPALGGVYKLASLENAEGVREPRIKLSEQAIKVSLPGRLTALRLFDRSTPVGDLLVDIDHGQSDAPFATLATGDAAPSVRFDHSVDLCESVMRGGQRVAPSPPLAEARARAMSELSALAEATLAPRDATPYPVYLDAHVASSRATLMATHRPTDKS